MAEKPVSAPINLVEPLILARDQVRRVDELAIARYAIPSLILMENAGRSAAEIIQREYGPSGRACICCGGGNNGGDGFVIARHLHNAGWSVRIIQTSTVDRMTPDTLANFRIATAMNLPCDFAPDALSFEQSAKSITPDEVLIDALLGTGFTGEVRSPLAEMMDVMNEAKRRATVAIDVPSGLDCDTGRPSNHTVRSDLTITFVAVKRGFLSNSAKPFLGRVEVAEIGAPKELIRGISEGKL